MQGKIKQSIFKVCVRVSAWVYCSDLSIPAKLSLSSAVSVGKSSSVSLAFPAAIFFPSSPLEEAEPRLRAAAQAAAARDTPHDCMENRDAGTNGSLRQIKEGKLKGAKRSKTFLRDEKMRFDVVNPFGGDRSALRVAPQTSHFSSQSGIVQLFECK